MWGEEKYDGGDGGGLVGGVSHNDVAVLGAVECDPCAVEGEASGLEGCQWSGGVGEGVERRG